MTALPHPSEDGDKGPQRVSAGARRLRILFYGQCDIVTVGLRDILYNALKKIFGGVI